MKDDRYKEIMNGLGMSNSQSLLLALKQVANEASNEAMIAERNRCTNMSPNDLNICASSAPHIVWQAYSDAIKRI